MNSAEDDASTAVQAEALYLINLLLVPGLAFLGLLWLARRHSGSVNQLTRCHMKQTIVASLWSGGLLTLVSIAILLLGGLHEPATWVLLILYFTCCHAVLVMFGILGLARALAGQVFVYPLIGSRKW